MIVMLRIRMISIRGYFVSIVFHYSNQVVIRAVVRWRDKQIETRYNMRLIKA